MSSIENLIKCLACIFIITVKTCLENKQELNIIMETITIINALSMEFYPFSYS